MEGVMQVHKQSVLDGGILAVARMEMSYDELLACYKGDIGWLSGMCAKSQYEKLYVRVLLQELIGEGEIVYEASGRPLLKLGGWNISVSHTRGYVAVLLHPTAMVGVDIESRSGRPLRLSERFVSDEERCAGELTEEYAELCWCAKEAVYKFFADEAIDMLTDIKVAPFNVATSGAIEVVVQAGVSLQVDYEQNDDYTLVWCGR